MPHHLAKLVPGRGQVFLVDAILAAVLQSLEPCFRFLKSLERMGHLQLLLLLLAETLVKLTNVIKGVLVFAAWLTPSRRNQFAPQLIDDLRELSATPASEDHADLGFQTRAETCQCRIGQGRPTERLSLLHPEDAPHTKRLQIRAPVAGLCEAQEVAKLVLSSVRFQQAPIGTLQPRIGVLYEALGQRVLGSVDFKDQLHNRGRATSIVLQCNDWPRPGAVPLEQHCSQRVQQAGLAKLVRPNDQVETVPELAQLCRHRETLELVD